MAYFTTNDFKTGMKILLDKLPHAILDLEFVKPGKGQAFTRVKLKQLTTGKVLDKTFKAMEMFEEAEVQELILQYLYRDEAVFHFMDPKTFEQIEAPLEIMQTALPWILGEELCTVTLWNGAAITVVPPTFVELKVTETDPGLKGDTAGTAGKPAILETGATVRVPLFVQIGEKIKVDTRDKSYVSRATKS